MYLIEQSNKKIKGGISLTVIVILSGILLLAGITIVLSSIDLLSIVSLADNNATLKNNSRTCLEESMYRLKFNIVYEDSFNIPLDQGDCTADVTDDSTPGIKIITVTSTIESHTSEEVTRVDVSAYPFQILD